MTYLFSTSPIEKPGKIFLCRSGATAVLFALLLPLLLIAVGVGVDLGRLHLAQSRAQNALDSGLLGAATTAAQRPVKEEAQALFNANYPVDYQGTQLTGFEVTQEQQAGGATAWNGMASLTVPMTFMRLAGKNTLDFTVRSQVTLFPQQVASDEVELALVLDNTGSMSTPLGTGTRLTALRAAATDLINILFGQNETHDTLYVSIIPYATTVNIGPGRNTWVQPASQATYNAIRRVANRDGDNPRTNNPYEITDTPPGADNLTKFRSVNGASEGSLASLLFAVQTRSTLINRITSMVAGGNTRINVGLMWGWFTLSTDWQGMWDNGRPDLPLGPGSRRSKWLVLMTDGLNTGFLGNGVTVSNDNTSTAALCTAIKQQGITVYTVGLGTGAQVNQTLLRNCASLPEYYFLAPTAEQLRIAFQAIGEQIVRKTSLRLTR